MKIKRIIERLYEFDFSSAPFSDKTELICNKAENDLNIVLRKQDLNKGFIVKVDNYKNGLVFMTDNDGELLNHPKWLPAVISFKMLIYGVKKDHWYRLTVDARDSGKDFNITYDRSLSVKVNNDETINVDLSGVQETLKTPTYFRATGTDIELEVSLGKIFLSNIVLEEIEPSFEDDETEDFIDCKMSNDKRNLKAACVFNIKYPADNSKRYVQFERTSGLGLSLFYDTFEHLFVIEKDNINETFKESLYADDIEVVLNKAKLCAVADNQLLFDELAVYKVSNDISPNTLKRGYIQFAVFKDGLRVKILPEGRLYISIYKIS